VPKVVRSTIVDAPCDTVWAVLRDFDGMPSWHPPIRTSAIERQRPSAAVGCVRRLTLADGAEIREQLLTLSDLEMTYSYCMLDTPLPLFNYVAHARLLPVTDGNRTFWQWEAQFDARPQDETDMVRLIGTDIFETGFAAMKSHLKLAA
jgi:hypothetical protein